MREAPWSSPCVHQFAEIGVFRNQDAALAQRPVHHRRIGRAFSDFGNRRDIVAGIAKGANNSPAQLSSARNFIIGNYCAAGALDSSRTSSWATLAAP